MARTGLILIGFLVVLSGCTAVQTAFVDGGIKKAQDTFDTASRAKKAALCAMSVGAYHRSNTAAERGAIDTLCDPDK